MRRLSYLQKDKSGGDNRHQNKGERSSNRDNKECFSDMSDQYSGL